jgi:hypothetical protein
LRTFEQDELEKSSVVVVRRAPLVIVIWNSQFARGPGATD